jgi:hypothetical protein
MRVGSLDYSKNTPTLAFLGHRDGPHPQAPRISLAIIHLAVVVGRTDSDLPARRNPLSLLGAVDFLGGRCRAFHLARAIETM